MNSLLNTLKKADVFTEVPSQQLEWLIDKGEVLHLKPGDIIFKKDDPIDKMFYVLEGLIAIKLQQNDHFRELSQILPGGISGALPYSRAEKATAMGVAETSSKVLIINKVHFKEMIGEHHELTTALVHIMTTRVREFTTAQQQNDKMMALGKLSAGLAHELNNPASAVVRSSSELAKYQNETPLLLRQVNTLNISTEGMETIHQLMDEKTTSGGLSLEEKTDLEDELLSWLDAHELEKAYEIAETLTAFNFSIKELETIDRIVPDKNIEVVLKWIDNSLTCRKLVSEINEASKRISDLVQAIKSYSHMDRTPEKETLDIREGINSTVTMLGHKLKKKNIQLKFDLPADLPKVQAYAGTLNQVWTNLLDNAIDAVDDNGLIEIEAIAENDHLQIDVKDSGQGIPEDIQNKIFDPFYTTKDVGKGTGLGLDVVQKIIKQHDGKITVTSKPGNTVFTICLPLTSSVESQK